MYSTCLFCHKSLGANEVIEHLPIGRRLAFDGAQGRLWVVCTACRRWNLTPIEVRWEAIEECERQFRTARVRASTDEIGLARLPEGLELVRIGKAPRAELAAWRYVDSFRRRRRQAIVGTAASLTVLAGLVAGGYALVGAGTLTSLIINGYNLVSSRRIVHRVVEPYGTPIDLRVRWVRSVRWVPSPPGKAFAIDLLLREYRLAPRTQLEGEAAERAVRPVLAYLNRYAGPRVVKQAVDDLNRDGDPIASGSIAQRANRMALVLEDEPISLALLSDSERLAMEMSIAEREEQRLLEGELAGLTLAWREAEEIAAIADNLLLPESVKAWLLRHGR